MIIIIHAPSRALSSAPNDKPPTRTLGRWDCSTGYDPSAQNSWPASKRARVSRQDFLGRRRSYQDAGIVLLFPKNFSGEGRWITARHKHSDFPLDMFDALFKRPRRFFVNAQRGIDLHPAIRRITRLDRPQPSWNSVLRHRRFLPPR